MVAKLKLKGSGLVSCETQERELPAQFLGSPDPTMFFRSVISSGTCCPLFFFKKVRYKKRTAKKLKTTRLASWTTLVLSKIFFITFCSPVIRECTQTFSAHLHHKRARYDVFSISRKPGRDPAGSFFEFSPKKWGRGSVVRLGRCCPKKISKKMKNDEAGRVGTVLVSCARS